MPCAVPGTTRVANALRPVNTSRPQVTPPVGFATVPVMLNDIALSLAMLAVIVLTGGGLWLMWKRQDTKRGMLMLVAALVIAANVAIWTIPPA